MKSPKWTLLSYVTITTTITTITTITTTRILTKKISRTGLITVYNFESDEICDLKWKTTSPNMEDDLTQNGRRPKMKTTKNEDDQK